MRVLVATDSWPALDSRAVGPALDSRAVGTALARAWAGLGDEVAVIPLGAAGRGFGRCLGQLTGARALSPRLPGGGPDRWTASSAPLGEYLRGAIEASGQRPVLEIPSAPWRDGGRGMAGTLGLPGTPSVPMSLITTAEEAERPLTGLRGLVSVEGRAEGMDPARMLRLDQELCEWAEELTGLPDAGTAPGSGAAGGVGLLVSAIGGEVTTGTRFLLDAAGAEATAAGADLIVTGCEELDAMSLAEEVVATVTALGGRVGVPVIAVTRTNSVSARELREAGLEAAQPLGPGTGEPVDIAELTRRAEPVARTWHW